MAKIKYKTSTKKRINNFWWPEITDLKTARHVAYYGLWATLLNVGITSLFIVLEFFGVKLLDIGFQGFVDIIIFSVIAVGIYKLNKYAAIAGLLFYLFEISFSILFSGNFSIGWMTIIFVFLYINSIRGTFAYQAII